MKNKMVQKIALSLLLVALAMAAGIILSTAGDRARGSSAAQPASKMATLEDNVLAALAVPAAEAAPVTKNLCASDGTITMPDSTIVTVWGFVDTGGGACTTGLVTSLPGPVLEEITAGDTVTINLTNALSENVSIIISGQDLTASGGVAGTFTAEAASGGGTVSYEFTAQEGTYLYESGSNPSIQIPMGLYGALIVDPATPGQAYGQAYDQEAVLLLSEIDLNLNADPGGFNLLDYHPTYWLINGQSYPDTDTIMANPGDQVLLRYLNAGFDHPSMELLGGYQTVIAKDSYVLNNAFDVVAETIPAGTTADMIVDTTGLEGSLPLYNRNMYVTNGDAYPGGMLTFLEINAPVGDPPEISIASPAQGSTVYGGAVAVQIAASDAQDDPSPGSGLLTTVQWNVDGGPWLSANWTGTSYEASLDTTGLSDGGHTINARVTDSDGNTSTDSNSVVVNNVPAVSVFAPAEGATIFGDTVLVQIDATDAEDAAGTLDVFFDVDGGASTPAPYNGISGYYEAVLDTTTGLSDGPHTINAQATDDRGFSSSDGNNVTVSNAPSVNIVAPAEGATVSSFVTVQIDASDAEDAAGSLTVMWDVDGGAPQAATWTGPYYEGTWDTATAGSGSHTINVSATDSRANTANDSNNVTVGSNSIHIGDLDGSSAPGGGPNWNANVVATVHAVDESPVEGATVTMEATRIRKSNGTAALSTLTCITDASGTCPMPNQSVNSNQFENSVTFTVTSVTNAAPYQSGSNHDPDGDSDGTTIVVQGP